MHFEEAKKYPSSCVTSVSHIDFAKKSAELVLRRGEGRSVNKKIIHIAFHFVFFSSLSYQLFEDRIVQLNR
jgi:hypothetical protein